MDLYTKHAMLLGRNEAWLDYAIRGLKGETALQGKKLAEYLEERIRQTEEEINSQLYEHRNNSERNTQSTESNTKAVTGEI